jgi:hypothetical protein
MRAAGASMLAAWIAFAAAPGLGADDAGEIERLLAELRLQGPRFKPDKLRKTGLRGFRALLDRLLPETADRKPSAISQAEVARLIRDLGKDDYRTREAATRKLVEAGPVHRGLVAEAARSKDPEISLRARTILAEWDSGSWSADRLAVAEYGTGFLVYLDGMADEACWVELARRVRLAFERACPRGRKRMILAHCAEQIAKSGKDKYGRPLMPLLKHPQTSVAVWVTRTFGSHSGNRYFPSLLIEALKSDRELVVDTAISWAPNCWDASRAKEVRKLLARIFDGENERLKFHACFPLMHDYQDKRAIAYLLSQAASGDRDRALRAIGWLGDSCNSGRPARPELLKKLVPLLTSADAALRRAAAEALGTYSGEAVVKSLIPLLGDKTAIIASEVSRALLNQRDKAMLKRRLSAAAQDSPNEAVRQRAKQLLAKLAAETRP